MPHLKIEYTANLDALDGGRGMALLCQALAREIIAFKDDRGQAVFPAVGTRVLAYPAPCYAVVPEQPDFAFVYLNLRITPGRDAALVQAAGEALLSVTRRHFAQLVSEQPVGITLHIDEHQPVYEGKHGSLRQVLEQRSSNGKDERKAG